MNDFIAAYQSGASHRDLAARYGVHPRTVRRWLRAGGVQMRPPGKPPSGPQWADEQIIDAYQAGAAVRTVARQAHRSDSYVAGLLQAAGLLQPRLDAATLARLRRDVGKERGE